MNNEVETLQGCLVPFGYLDMKRACEIADELWMTESDIADVIDQFKDECGLSGYEWIDPVYLVMDHALYLARNKICEITGYDFIDDFNKSGSEIYTYWNYMCSFYDWSDAARGDLLDNVSNHLAQLQDDPFCSFLLTELEIEG